MRKLSSDIEVLTREKQGVPGMLLVLGLLVLAPGCGRHKEIPPEHVKMTVYSPSSSEAGSLDILVNNIKVGEAERGEAVVVSFPAAPDGKNSLEFVSGAYKIHSAKKEFQASVGAELNVNVQYTHYAILIPDSIDFDIRTVKEGEPLASITGATIDPEVIRREAVSEIVRGNPGTRYRLTRSRNLDRQITLSDSARLELSASASAGFGLVDVTARIKQTVSSKDTVLLKDREEISRTIEVTLDSSGTAKIHWVDLIKKGKATYRFNGRTKELEFEVLHSSELTILN